MPNEFPVSEKASCYNIDKHYNGLKLPEKITLYL